MLDIATAYNKYKFLGNDFLTWLWFLIETEQDLTRMGEFPDTVSLDVGNSLTLENNLGDASTEKITIKGDQAGLEEGTTALKKGARVTEMNLACHIGPEDVYTFTIKGESFNLTGVKLPATGGAQSEEDIEGVVLERAHLLLTVTRVLDTLFTVYLTRRISDDWPTGDLTDMRRWIHEA